MCLGKKNLPRLISWKHIISGSKLNPTAVIAGSCIHVPLWVQMRRIHFDQTAVQYIIFGHRVEVKIDWWHVFGIIFIFRNYFVSILMDYNLFSNQSFECLIQCSFRIYIFFTVWRNFLGRNVAIWYWSIIQVSFNTLLNCTRKNSSNETWHKHYFCWKCRQHLLDVNLFLFIAIKTTHRWTTQLRDDNLFHSMSHFSVNDFVEQNQSL